MAQIKNNGFSALSLVKTVVTSVALHVNITADLLGKGFNEERAFLFCSVQTLKELQFTII